MKKTTKTIFTSLLIVAPLLASSVTFAKTAANYTTSTVLQNHSTTLMGKISGNTTTTPKGIPAGLIYAGMQGKCKLYATPIPKHSTFVKDVKVLGVTVKEEFLKWGNRIEPVKYVGNPTIDGHKLVLIAKVEPPEIFSYTVCPPQAKVVKVIQHRGLMLIAPKQVLVKK